MTINAIKCLKCGDIIYSRSHHDFHWCSCKSCAIDGGFNYLKITGDYENWKSVQINVLDDKDEIEAKKILFDDWNKRINKYGVLKSE